MQGLNVLINCLPAVSGGAVSHLRNLLPPLCDCFLNSRLDHRLTFLAHKYQQGLVPSNVKANTLWLHGARSLGVRRVLQERWLIPRLVKRERISAVFTPYQIGARVTDARHVMMVQNMEAFLFGSYRYTFENWLRNILLKRQSLRCLLRADRVIAISGFVRDFLKRNVGLPDDRIRLIYHGRESGLTAHMDVMEDTQKLRGLGIDGEFILTCGSLLPYRRCEDVIEAFGQLGKVRTSRLRLIVAGSGTDRRYARVIQRKIVSSPHPQRILTLGQVPWEMMGALYRQCQMCVLATEIEACPSIAIEAMAAGCAIIASDRPPLPEMFAGCCEHYPARDVGMLSGLMSRLLVDGARRSELRRLALERSKAFSWERCAEETYAALTEWE